MNTYEAPSLVHCKPKAEDYREASVELLHSAQEHLARLISTLETTPVDFGEVARALSDFYVYQNRGILAANYYAEVADCSGSA